MESKLMSALESGMFKLAKILIYGGHEVNFCTDTGITPLMLACKLKVRDQDINEKIEIISTLLENNANINAKDNEGRTALMYAMHSRCKSTIQVLKKQGLLITVDAKKSKVTAKMIWDSFDLNEDYS
ncbi:Hypothetical predicted protein [Mytilus galloprovincialis]|uniref:Uncharacterized protein n=1 Tax=Mytilus galloprovincialis TaxID=29158 RepID=A0A8B6FJT7_MYTGA|nr:Hypothetical predicted protein [Mytilus galloprovincialis]